MKGRTAEPGTRRYWAEIRSLERPVLPLSHHSRYTMALGYANSYHIGMSSLAFQRVFELIHRTPEWSCERFFADGTGMPLSVEAATPLNSFGTLAFSISFEEDYVHLLQMLTRAGIALRRKDRGAGDPVIIVGGSCAMINPLTLSEFVDVFALGAAENLLPALLAALAKEPSRAAVLERLATVEGFYVPAAFGPGQVPESKLKKLELSEEQMRLPGNLPTTAIVTPSTEFSDKFLIEMSRGCPEKCRYCWATFGMGRFRWHPTDEILGSLERARPVTDQLGFVATAVGDHPEIERILREAGEMGFRSAVSSVRIPAVTEGVLEALHTSGGRSITLAPETGSDALRVKLNKPIPNEALYDKVRLIFRQGFTGLKLYFIIGLPEETEEDVRAILEVAARCRTLMLEELAPTGVIGQIHVGANILIPKPYTGYQREQMEAPESLKRKISILNRGVAALDNVSLGTMSVRQAIWQAYLSKADRTAAEPLERAAHGATVASLLREFRDQIDPLVFEPPKGPLPWQFLRTA
jgi:radical SAM superfamily enzyme YgiQ (UPF0313 family)